MDGRKKLTELLDVAATIANNICDAAGCCENCDGHNNGCTLYHMADYLIANGVTIAEEKPEKPPTDLRGKCGGCDYAVPVPAFGSTYAYVKCTHPEHLAKYRKARHHSGIRQRTTRACKKYRQKEGL